MVTEHGTVVKVDDGHVWVDVLRKSTCFGCQTRSSCSQFLADNYFSRIRCTIIKIKSDRLLFAGDRVQIGVDNYSLLKASAWCYLLPLFFIMSAVGLSAYLRWGDGGTVMALLVGLLTSYTLLRCVGRNKNEVCDVVILDVLPKPLTV